ncbi:MAG TPA: hypothetical protein VMB26_08380, partial [Candidatus Binataceae bacterium]|nr:hypothetical protein [Candidatus Binataceae bacterium]
MSRLLIPVAAIVLVTGFLAGCSTNDDHLQAKTSSPATVPTAEWQPEQMMATGGDLVMNAVA